MRKLVFILIAMVTLGVTSCGTCTNTNPNDSTAVDSVDTLTVDTVQVDSVE